jgi:hypothetical protein
MATQLPAESEALKKCSPSPHAQPPTKNQQHNACSRRNTRKQWCLYHINTLQHQNAATHILMGEQGPYSATKCRKSLCHGAHGVLAAFLFSDCLVHLGARISRVWHHMPDTGVVAVAAITVSIRYQYDSKPAAPTHDTK